MSSTILQLTVNRLEQLNIVRAMHQKASTQQAQFMEILQQAPKKFKAEFLSKEAQITRLLNQIVFTKIAGRQRINIRVIDFLEKLTKERTNWGWHPNYISDCFKAKDYFKEKIVQQLLIAGLLEARYEEGGRFVSYKYERELQEWAIGYVRDEDRYSYTEPTWVPGYKGIKSSNYDCAKLGEVWDRDSTGWFVTRLGVYSCLKSRERTN